MNNWYYYDMMLNKKNARFVNSKLYAYFSSPTYQLGYLDTYGYALLSGYRRMGSPQLSLAYALLLHATILTANHFIEQPSVKKMYFQPN